MLYTLIKGNIYTTELSDIEVVLVTKDINKAVDTAKKLREDYETTPIDGDFFTEGVITDVETNNSYNYHHVTEDGGEFILVVEEINGDKYV